MSRSQHLRTCQNSTLFASHLEGVLVVLAALRAAEPGEVVVDPGLGRTGDVGDVGLQAPQLDLRLQGVGVAAARAANPVLQSRR